jgi:hypothetical protein
VIGSLSHLLDGLADVFRAGNVQLNELDLSLLDIQGGGSFYALLT